jgi:hypothetical protein
VKNVNGKTKGIILTLLVLGTLVVAVATTQVAAYANETTSQAQIQQEHQCRQRLTAQDCACQAMGDGNALQGDSEQLAWQHQTQMRNANQTCPQTQL